MLEGRAVDLLVEPDEETLELRVERGLLAGGELLAEGEQAHPGRVDRGAQRAAEQQGELLDAAQVLHLAVEAVQDLLQAAGSPGEVVVDPGLDHAKVESEEEQQHASADGTARRSRSRGQDVAPWWNSARSAR